MNSVETINERITRMIEREGLSIGTFAKKCGVPDSTIRSIVNTERRPGYDLIVKMIETVDRPWCDANWLVMGQETTVTDQDTKKLLKLIADQQKALADQQRTIEEQRKRIDQLTDRLLASPVK